MLESARAKAAAPTFEGRRAWPTLFMLCALIVFSLVDRQVFVLLIGPLKAEFQLSDVQIGLLIGTAFAVVYSFLGIPAGRIADRGNRKILVITGVAIWSFSTIGSAFATTYAALIALRLGLAAGEAVLTPAAHSMIGDLFPPAKRSLAASIYNAATMVGSPLAFSGGALLIAGIERAREGGMQTSLQVWQIVLLAVGLPTVVLGIIFVVVAPEPIRSSHGSQTDSGSGRVVVRQILRHKRLYSGLLLGTTLAAGCSYALLNWGMESFKRDFGWTAVSAGSVFGPLTLVAGVTGALVAPWISARVKSRGRDDAVVLVSMGFIFLAALSLTVGFTQPNPILRLALLGIGLTGTQASSLNIIVAMQEVAPARMRATFVALLYMAIALFGAGAVPVIVPLVADNLGGGLSPALAVVCAISSGVSLLLFWSVRADYQREAKAGFPSVDGAPQWQG
ncbi:MAG: MFS transporter [Novosphingobium sp.]|nr:MFS transporter [Novosphingobium sp.]